MSVLLAVALGVATGQLDGVWAGDFELASSRQELQVEIQGDACTAVLPCFHQFDFPMRVDADSDSATLTGRTPAGPIVLTGSIRGDELSGRWSLGGMAGAFELDRVEGPAAGHLMEEIVFQSGDAALAGTVVRPRSGDIRGGIVWVHGSGSIGRRSTSYRWPALLLARHGIASLIYDKRGVGASEGDWREASFETLASDAIAARDALATELGASPTSIGAGGLSQGPSWIIPLAMQIDGGFGFVVAMSPTGSTPAEQHLYVVRRRMERAGASEQEILVALSLHEAIDEVHRDGADRGDVDRRLSDVSGERWFEASLLPSEAGDISDWMRGWLWLDPRPLWREVDAPVLLLWGSGDDIVDHERSERLITDALSSNESVRSLVFEGAGHELMIDRGPLRLSPPDLHAAMTDWIDHVLMKTRESDQRPR